jgi:invasion protein IalB
VWTLPVSLRLAASLSLGIAILMSSASAWAANIPPTAQPSNAPAAPESDVPQQTTATFGEWTLRCDHPRAAPKMCEVVQTLNNQGRPVAQIAIGRVARGQPMHLTILVPPSVTLDQVPQFTAAPDKPTELTWRRCLPAGCLAETALSDDLLKRMRARAEPSQINFADGAGHAAGLPFSPRGLSQALDALVKEDAS